MQDNFGDRMKAYESLETGRKFIPLLPIYARIDGRSFSRFTRSLQRPYDTNITRAMVETTKYLVEETHAIIGYTQSDEISLLWQQSEYNSGILFDGKIQKLVSVLSGMASAIFNQHCLNNEVLREIALKQVPAFDCRVFQLPNKIEAANAFLWREKDATKNAVSMATRHFYSAKEMHGKSSAQMQEMIFKKGQNFNDYPAFFKRGTFVRRVAESRLLTEVERLRIPEKYRPLENELVVRSKMVELEMPSFSKVANRVEVIFDGVKPIVINEK